MRIFFENVNFMSRSGPNSFGKKLADCLKKKDYEVITGIPESKPDVQLSFLDIKLHLQFKGWTEYTLIQIKILIA